MTRARVVPVVVGLALAAGALTDRIGPLVRPWFLPALGVTGAALVVAAWRRPVPVRPWAALLLVLPIAAGLALPPQAVGRLSAGALDPAAVAPRLGERSNPLLNGQEGPVTLLDILLAERQVGGVLLAGRAVQVDGTVSGPDTISRQVMVCCALDARSISLPVVGARLPATGTWVRVTGTLTTHGTELLLRARRVQRIPTPDRPIL